MLTKFTDSLIAIGSTIMKLRAITDNTICNVSRAYRGAGNCFRTAISSSDLDEQQAPSTLAIFSSSSLILSSVALDSIGS